MHRESQLTDFRWPTGMPTRYQIKLPEAEAGALTPISGALYDKGKATLLEPGDLLSPGWNGLQCFPIHFGRFAFVSRLPTLRLSTLQPESNWRVCLVCYNFSSSIFADDLSHLAFEYMKATQPGPSARSAHAPLAHALRAKRSLSPRLPLRCPRPKRSLCFNIISAQACHRLSSLRRCLHRRSSHSILYKRGLSYRPLARSLPASANGVGACRAGG